MAYLGDISIIFSGDFQSDVSTVNNDVRHYDISSFNARFQTPSSGDIQNGWWNPDGGAAFHFVNCKIVRCIRADGREAEGDGLVGGTVSDLPDRPSGKMVDLDPQMQFTSELWGVGISLRDSAGKRVLAGRLLATGFRDAQTRQFAVSEHDSSYIRNGQPLGGTWYSRIRDIDWGDSESECLKELRLQSKAGSLAITLHAFGYYYSHTDGRFSMGKLIGCIGPWYENEPDRFAPTRRLYGVWGRQPVFAYSNFQVSGDRLLIDLGMSCPVQDPLGTPFSQFGILTIAVSKNIPFTHRVGQPTPPAVPPDSYRVITRHNALSDPEWLLTSGGIVSVHLDEEARKLLESNQLLILLETPIGRSLIARESVEGLYVRADTNVIRLDPGKSVSTNLYVYKWGLPLSGQIVQLSLQPRRSGGGGGPSNDPDPPTANIPEINFPLSAINFVIGGPTDSNGMTLATLRGGDPGNPRGYIDGQIYLYDYELSGMPEIDLYFNDTIMVHLRNEFPDITHPTWRDVGEIWIQFGNLYPIMSKHIVEMSYPETLLARKNILIFVLTRDMNDPDYMPVTRDLSDNKRKALVRWLEQTRDISDLDESESVTVMQAMATATEKEINKLDILAKAKAGDATALNILMENAPKLFLPTAEVEQ